MSERNRRRCAALIGATTETRAQYPRTRVKTRAGIDGPADKIALVSVEDPVLASTAMRPRSALKRRYCCTASSTKVKYTQ